MKKKNLIRGLTALVSVLLLVGCQPTPPKTEGETKVEAMTAQMPDVPALIEENTEILSTIRARYKDVPTTPATDFTFEVQEDQSVRLLTFTGTDAIVIVPEEIDGLPVRALTDGLFANQTALTVLYLPDSVSEIGEGILTGCRSLQLLRTPQLSKVRDEAGGSGYLSYLFGAKTPMGTGFRVPSSLDTVVLSGDITAIDEYAFFECSRLKYVLLPTGTTKIGKFAFADCTQLSFLRYPDTLRELDDYALMNCSSLTVLTLTESTERIGLGAFYGTNGLKQLTLPFLSESEVSENRYIGYLFGAESYMWNESFVPSSLARLHILHGDIADDALYGCSGLIVVDVPSDCAHVGVRAFYGCSSLAEIVLPDTVLEIGEVAFAYCTSLYRVTWGDALKAIGLQAFMGCTNLYEISLPGTLEMLPPSAFADCRALTKVNFGTNLSVIGDNAFYHCVALRSVEGKTNDIRVGKGNEELMKIIRPSMDFQ